jgi:hypothetical protein
MLLIESDKSADTSANRVEKMPLERLPWQANFYRPAGRRGNESPRRKCEHFI